MSGPPAVVRHAAKLAMMGGELLVSDYVVPDSPDPDGTSRRNEEQEFTRADDGGGLNNDED